MCQQYGLDPIALPTTSPLAEDTVSWAGVVDYRYRSPPNARLSTGSFFRKFATYQNGSPTTIIGPPTSGTRVLNEFWRDALGGEWVCTVAGTPGTWRQIRPAAVTADPASGTIPTGYLILNVTTGHIKRHIGGYVWEIPAT